MSMTAEPQKEHKWLQKLVGEWTYESSCEEPGKPVQTFTGRETFRSVGDVWYIGESQGDVPGGGTAQMMITLGYDPAKKKYVGSWLGSMMTTLWIYEGSIDATGKILTLEAEGPNMMEEGKTAKYRDVIEFKSDDHRTLTSRMLGSDGKWQELMTAHYRRKK